VSRAHTSGGTRERVRRLRATTARNDRNAAKLHSAGVRTSTRDTFRTASPWIATCACGSERWILSRASAATSVVLRATRAERSCETASHSDNDACLARFCAAATCRCRHSIFRAISESSMYQPRGQPTPSGPRSTTPQRRPPRSCRA